MIGQIVTNTAGSVAAAVEAGRVTFVDVYSVVISAVVLGFLLWLMGSFMKQGGDFRG